MFAETVLILYLSSAKPFINKWVKSSANVLQSKQLIDIDGIGQDTFKIQ